MPNSLTNQRQIIVSSFGFTALQTTLLGCVDGLIEIITIWTGVKLAARYKDARAYVGIIYFIPNLLGVLLLNLLPWENQVGLLFSQWLTGENYPCACRSNVYVYLFEKVLERQVSCCRFPGSQTLRQDTQNESPSTQFCSSRIALGTLQVHSSGKRNTDPGRSAILHVTLPRITSKRNSCITGTTFLGKSLAHATWLVR